MPKWLDTITGRGKMDRLVNAAVKERMDLMAERFPIFEEEHKYDNNSISMDAPSTRWDRKSKSVRNLVKYITDKKRFISRRTTTGGYSIVRSPHRYDRIDSFFNKEAYFSRSVSRQIETMMRNGIDLVSEDRKMVALVRKELTRLQMDSGMSMEQMMWNWVKSIQTHGMLVIHKMRRRINDPTNNEDKRENKISRLRVMNPNNMMFYLDNNGLIVSAVERVTSAVTANLANPKRKKGAPPGIPIEDLAIVMVYDAGDDVFPVPPCFQMLDDILSLRSIEETIELLCFQFGSPLLHAQVGTQEEPASPEEVTGVNTRLIDMAPNGMVTTDHRVDIDVINIQKAVADLMPFVDHFKNRVIIGSGSSPISVGEGDCYDDKTETLTRNGWKHHTEIGDDEEIATYNPSTDMMEYHIPNYKYEGEYNGDMISFRTQKHVDIKVTPMHEMWVKRARHTTSKWQKIKAIDIYRGISAGEFGEFYMKANSSGIRHGMSSVIIPASCYTHRSDLNRSSFSIPSSICGAVLGYFISEGNLDKSKNKFRIMFSQKDNETAKKIRESLSGLAPLINYTEYNTPRNNVLCFNIWDKGLYEMIDANIGHTSHNKNIPRFAFLLDYNGRNSLLNSLIDGDGYRDPKVGSTNMTYYTVSKTLANDVQELAISLGYKAKVTRTLQDEKAWAKKGSHIYRVLIAAGKKDYYYVKAEHVHKEFYSGTIYCYNVPNHLFITRRNGKATIQGNTANRSTSESIDDALSDHCTYLANIVCNMINFNLIPDIQVSQGIDPDKLFDNDGELIVQAKFNEMRLEKQIARENHILNMWNSNIITHSEARQLLRKKPIAGKEEKDLQVHKIQIPLARAKGVSADGESGGAAAYTKTQSQPKNQHTTKSAPGSKKN